MVVCKVLIGTDDLLSVFGPPLESVAMFTKSDEATEEDDGHINSVDIRAQIHEDHATQEFFKACALCGTTQLARNGTRLEGTGNPTEIAIQALCWKAGSARKRWVQSLGWESRGEYPFDSKIKRMSAGYYNPLLDASYVCVKGATERVLSACRWKLNGIERVPMTEEDVAKVLAILDTFTSRGLRTLCISRRDVNISPPPTDDADDAAATTTAATDDSTAASALPDDKPHEPIEGADTANQAEEVAMKERRRIERAAMGEISLKDTTIDHYDREFVEGNLTFLGVVGIYDPPRVESKLSVTMCRRAGITVRMLTGDHFQTATAIAKEINLINDEVAAIPGRVMSGPDFDALSESEVGLMEELPLVVGRCSPNTKVRMIEQLHKRGRIVAMTGDGFNDAPSIQAADLGCAMGSGTDVTKGVADFVITDDNFATIVKALAEGRRIALSISKFVTHLLCGNMAETVVLVCGLGIMLDEQSVFVLSPMEILWLNLFTSSPPAIGLSMDPAPDYVLRVSPNLAGLFNLELLFDTLVYGISMGSLSLCSFILVLYGINDGPEGKNCNTSGGEGCEAIWRARTTGYVILYFGMLIHAYNVRFARISLFKMRWFDNPWLWGSFVFGVVTLIPMIYIPEVARYVFVHEMISWEWGVVAVSLILFVIVSECYKAIKNVIDPFEIAPVTPEEAENERRLFEGSGGPGSGVHVTNEGASDTAELVESELRFSMARQSSMASPL